MYGVMRERARNRPMQIAGLAVSALATVAAANLLMSGFGNFVGAFTPESTTLATITPEKAKETPPTVFDDTFSTKKMLPASPPIPLPNHKYIADDDDKAITVIEGEVSGGGKPGATVAPARTVRVAPKLRTQDKPPYPVIDIRERNEGQTSLGLCIDARGRVTSARLVTSSGHRRLDDAALRWVKDARFSPGSVDGAPQAVCGHTVVYEWRLEDAR